MTSTTIELADAYANETFFIGNGTSHPQKIKKLRAALEQRIKELEADAKRYRWLRDQSGFDMRSFLDVPDMTKLDAHVDRAMSEAALQKAVEISQEDKLP